VNKGNLVFLAIILVILGITGYLIYRGIREGEKIEIYWKSDNAEVLEFKPTNDGEVYLRLYVNGDSGGLILRFSAYKEIIVKVRMNLSTPIYIDPINRIKNGDEWHTWWRVIASLEADKWYVIEISAKNATVIPEPLYKDFHYSWGANPGYLKLLFGGEGNLVEVHISRD